MSYWSGVLIVLAFVAYALFSRKLAGSVVTGPMLFAGVGFAIGPAVLGWVDIQISNRVIHAIVEVTLAVVLFTDAASTDFKVFRRSDNLPLRMLLGMPLCMSAAPWARIYGRMVGDKVESGDC